MRHATILIPILLVHATLHAAEEKPAYELAVVPVLRQFCYDCHGADKAKAGVELESASAAAHLMKNPDQWVNVMRVLRDGTMPPTDKPQPSHEQRDQTVKQLRQTLESLDWPRDPGHSVVRRLTRAEYNNTVRDLLGVASRPADKFPADAGGGEGFDNNSATLYLPPILLERYLAAAQQVASEADAKLLLTARPDGKTSPHAAAETILKKLLPRAFRRPVTDTESKRFLRLFDESQKRGEPFEDSMRLVIKAVLVSPGFLFRIERDRAESAEPYPVSDFELATRLSYFLWSSMPDEELFDLARQNKLHDDVVLAAQVKRMLTDPRSRELAAQFATQWLDVRRIHDAEPDRSRYPGFTPELRSAMLEEAVTFFDAVVRNNSSLLDLVDSRYVYVNEPLAKHYSIANVSGPEFRRVELTDPNRGGVLTLGAVLTLTSYPARSSPVLRGKWVMEQVLGQHSPPPPMNVKTLPPDDLPREGLTFRQQLERHRADAQCAACHARLDPLGFGLENFDGVGRWRNQIGSTPVDASGKLTSGKTFTGPAELKKLILEQQEDFLRNLTRKMLGYALGRGVEPADTPAVLAILKSLEKNDNSSQTLVTEIVKSYPFRYRRNSGVTQDAK